MFNQRGAGFLDNIPPVTRNLLIINVLVFLAFSLLKSVPMTEYLALFYYKSPYFMPHQFITYMFMHWSFGHLFFNMFALFMFGRTLEMVWGPKRFLTYYIITGVGASLLHLLIIYFQVSSLESMVSSDVLANFYAGLDNMKIVISGSMSENAALREILEVVSIPMVGASGAIFGILVGFGMLFPNAELIMIPIPIPIKAKYFVIGYGVLELALGLSNNPADNVAHFAHLGGLLTGLIFLLYWKKKGTLHGNSFRHN